MPINDNLILPAAALETLYGNSLYIIERQLNKQLQKERAIPVKKLMTVITSIPVSQETDPGTYNFITGIVQACRIPLADVALLSTPLNEVNFKYIQDHCQSPLVLMFDLTPGDIGLPIFFPHFQLQLFSGVTYLAAPDLATLQQDKLLKSKLWLCLKQYFSI